MVEGLLLVVTHALAHGACSQRGLCIGCGSRLSQHLVAYLVGQAVVVLVLLVEGHGVASGIVEHHDVVELHVAKSLHTTVVPMRVVEIALAVEYGQCVLRERHVKRCLRNARPVRQL